MSGIPIIVNKIKKDKSLRHLKKEKLKEIKEKLDIRELELESVKTTIYTLKKIEIYVEKKDQIEKAYKRHSLDKDKINAVKEIYGKEPFDHELKLL